jgi:exonuclease I
MPLSCEPSLIKFSFTSDVEDQYQLQKTHSLINPLWKPVLSNTCTIGTNNIQYENDFSNTVFFRIVH